VVAAANKSPNNFICRVANLRSSSPDSGHIFQASRIECIVTISGLQPQAQVLYDWPFAKGNKGTVNEPRSSKGGNASRSRSAVFVELFSLGQTLHL